MSTESPIPKKDKTATSADLPEIFAPKLKKSIDLTTILGLFGGISLIFMAIALGQSDASFFNIPSMMIVVLGTMAVTAVSYDGKELSDAWHIFAKSMSRSNFNHAEIADLLVKLAVISKQKGVLALAQYEDQLKTNDFLYNSIQMTIDGQTFKEIDFVLSQEIAYLVERHRRTASMTKRASETAPAMGLIGTLVGLVQMLADLENPDTIGPAMAVALLTTFYGAIMGSVIMAPLTGKLEKKSGDEALTKTLIKTAAISIAKQENPRKLEMALNAILPPSQKIKYFD